MDGAGPRCFAQRGPVSFGASRSVPVRGRAPLIPSPSPANCAGEGSQFGARFQITLAACHPEAQARGTGPRYRPRGPKDPAAETYQLGRGSGHRRRGLGCRGALTRPRLCSSTLSHKQRGRGGTHQAWACIRRVGCGVGEPSWRLEMRPCIPRLPSPRPLSRKRERGEFDRAPAGVECVLVKPRAGRDSGPSRGFPLSQRQVHPPSGGFGIGERCRALACTWPRLDPSPRDGCAACECGAPGAQDDRSLRLNCLHATEPSVYPLSHAVCGRGWHACQRGRVRAPAEPRPRTIVSARARARKTH
jgi:hypothetical protein